MQTKYLIVALGVLVLITLGAGVYTVMQDSGEEFASPGKVDEVKPIPPSPVGEGKLKAETFTGTLELVDTGCFADGECYVMVDGKHVTALMGWSRDTVGSVVGVDGFGDLEQYIGKRVEVYAQVAEEGQYTLYGSEGFYIKPLSSTQGDMTTEGQGVDVSKKLEGTTFVWEKTVERDGSVVIPKKSAFTFVVENGQVRGGTDCNGYSGTIALEGSSMSLGAFMSTMMYCEGSEESVFTGALAGTVSYRFEEEKLVLSGMGGFPEVWLSPQKKVVGSLPPVTGGGCMVGGCSGQLCVDAKIGGDMMTTCEYRAEYGCYQRATCERQTSGQCGWTETKELSQCLLDAKNNPESLNLEVQ